MPAATYTTPRALNVGDTYELVRDGWTAPPGGSAYDGDVLPKTDPNDGSTHGDNRYYRRHNVARAWATFGGYWYTSAYQESGEPSPTEPQWVDYAPPFDVLGPGRYAIETSYRQSDNRASYPAVYRVNHAGGSTALARDQRLGTDMVWFALGEFEMWPGSFVRVEDTGTGSISFGNMRFRLLARVTPTNKPPVVFVPRYLDLWDDDGNGSESGTLDASRSFDPDGSIVSFVWTADNGVTLTNGAVTTTRFPTGHTRVQLTVTDHQGATNSARVLVHVRRLNEVTAFTPFELALTAANPTANPYLNGPEVTATFTGASGAATGLVSTVPGFWDGGATWRVRFAPTAAGDWSYTTASSDAGLNGRTGSFLCVAPTAEQVEANELLGGFLKADGHAWKLSNGRPFLAVGDTQWSFAEEFTLDEFKAWMDALVARGLNVMHGCIWLAIYTRNGLSPFRSRDPKTDVLQPAYFQQLDQMVLYANRRGIMMGLVLGGFPGNSQWWTKFGTQAREDRWFRYCVARYAAFNVRWVLYGEVNEANPSWGTWQAEAARKAALIKATDPYDHPIGSHHTTVDTATANNANIGYIEIQHGPDYGNAIDELALRAYGKPLWAEEYWYEHSHITETGTRATYENFVKAPCYPTFGSWMREHVTATTGGPTYAQQPGKPLFRWLLEDDEGLRRMGNFARFFRGINPLDFAPTNALVSRGFCGRFGNDYAVFVRTGGDVTLDLTGVSGTFDVRRIEVDTGAVATLPAVTGGGPRTLSTGSTNAAALWLRLQVPARLRPERQGNSLRLRWPVGAGDFQLWAATNMTPPVRWQRMSEAPTQSGAELTVASEVAPPARFFRLQGW